VGLWLRNTELNAFQLSESDVNTFHNYSSAEDLERQIVEPKQHRCPLICTEWLARTRGSLVRTDLPVFAREKVGSLNSGLVAGKTNTIYQWKSPRDILNPKSWFINKTANPKIWFHDLLRTDGTPYNQTEIELFKKFTES
jgi:hypothetical protein